MTKPQPGLLAREPAPTIPEMADQPMRARVRNGRLVLDEPTDLPEGTEIELVPADSSDDLSEEDRRRLHEALARSEEDIRQGRVTPADQVIDRVIRSDE